MPRACVFLCLLALLGAARADDWIVRFDGPLASGDLPVGAPNCTVVDTRAFSGTTYFSFRCARVQPLIEAVAASWRAAAPGVSASAFPLLVAEPMGVYRAVQVERTGVDAALDRLDARARAFDGTLRAPGTGAGVRAYVVDTGLYAGHQEFLPSGRAQFLGNTLDAEPPGDCNGHGTHVASLVAGRAYGVAPDAQLFGVKVLDCSGTGTTYSVAMGVELVRAHCEAAANQSEGVVVNLSIGGPASNLLDSSILGLLAACPRAVVVAAAGNGGSASCTSSPGGSAGVLSVAATDTPSDALAWFSNYGACVRVAAPGTSVLGAGTASASAFGRMSGTSASAPLVAGIVALGLEAINLPGDAVRDFIVESATPGVVGRPAYGRLPLAYAGLTLPTSGADDPVFWAHPFFSYGLLATVVLFL